MVISGVIFGVVILLIGFLVFWLIRSESEDQNVDEKLKLYGHSSVFQKFYDENAYSKASSVVKRFERNFPEEVNKIRQQQIEKENRFNKNRDRYNYLIFKYQEELLLLRESGAKYFSRQELSKYFDVKTINDLVESHVINFYNDTYLLHEKYIALHPFEKNTEGKPIKIEI